MRTVVGLLLVAVLAVPTVHAQSPSSPPDLTDNAEAFAPLDLPDPNRFRAGSGTPGEAYWQQRADYTIDVTLDPTQNRVTGRETITYTNNSPDSLEYLWVQLDQNLFKPDSRGASVVPPDARFSGFFAEGGYDISNVRVTQNGETAEPTYLIDDTRMRIKLAEPLPAEGGQLELSVDFAFIIPEYGADRMGRLEVDDGTVYQLAQWYPRMFVYDDVTGWNALPYLGQGEYYLEYGHFDLNITVPREFIVASSGELQNPEEVLTETQRQRLDNAQSSRETVTIISRDEVGQPNTRPEGDGPLTWRYRAEDVRDVAWAASQAFIWDAATADPQNGESVLAMSYYPKEGLGQSGRPGWEESTRYVQHSVEYYSEQWEPYPYPVAINVAGIVGGMEYPQIMFCSVRARGRSLFGVTDHEFGHTWFPMLVGSDERRHVWMDEGLTTFLGVYSTDAFYDETTLSSMQSLARLVASSMRSPIGQVQPIMTYADRINRRALGFLAYRKPAAGLVLLREYIVGPERFDAAMEEYIDRWAYKHPQPADFFRTIEDVAGEDLDWFWRGWFEDTAVLDHSVEGVETSGNDQTIVTLATNEDLMMPITMEVTYGDGSTETRRIPVEAFFTGDRHQVALAGTRTVTGIQLDPQQILPDVNRGNDSWSASDASSSSSSSSSSN